MRNTYGPAVVLGCVVMACVTVLVALNKPVTGILAVINALMLPIGGLLLAKVDHVKDQGNGTQHKLLNMIESLSAQVASMSPPAIPPPTIPPLPTPRDPQ